MSMPPLEDAAVAAAEAEWRRRVETALRGRPFESLHTTTDEGITFEPLYRRAAEPGPRALRQRPGRWRIAQRMDHPDPGAANALALTDLEGGADGLVLVTATSPAARGFGVAIEGAEALAQALEGVELDLIGLRLDAGPEALTRADDLAALTRRRRLTAAALAIDVGHDPIGLFARGGRLAESPAAMGRAAAAAVPRLRDAGLAGRLFLADGRAYQEAGAGPAQELAAVLATALAYLRLLSEAGLSLDAASNAIAALLVADADQFFTLAKFRALRRLWARVEQASGLAPQPLALHAETGWRMMTRHDPAVNMLRTTMGVFSAGLGGADWVTALPHTLALGLPDAGARRLARNSQLILIEEAHLAVVADPAAGAGGFEALTEALCVKAWALFQTIEAAGGMIAALEAGVPQAAIAATRAAHAAAVATGRAPITGTTVFPNLAEAPAEVLMTTPPPAARVESPPPPRCAPLVDARDGEPFELLRARADAAFAASGRRPQAVLVSLGESAEVRGRASFAANMFASAGIEARHAPGGETPEAAAEALRAMGLRIACICAGETAEEAELHPIVGALRQAGVARIYYAGRPGVRETALRAMGVHEFIFSGCNASALLEDLLAALLTP